MNKKSQIDETFFGPIELQIHFTTNGYENHVSS